MEGEDKTLNDTSGDIDGADTQEVNEQESPLKEPLKFRVPRIIVGFLIIVVALDLVCMVRFPKILHDYKIYKTVDERIENGYTSAAIYDLYDVAKKHPNTISIMIKLVDISMENGYYDMAAYIIDTYLSGRELDNTDYNKINRYYLKLDSYYNAYDAVDQIFSTSTGQDSENNLYSDEIKEQLNELLVHSDMDQSYLYYFIGLMETDKNKGRDYLQQCYDIDNECLDVRVQLSIINRRLGDMDKAKKYGEEALKKDKQDSGALRAMSTITLVKGDLEKGLGYAEEAYNINPEGAYIRDTYLVALYANGRSEDAQNIKKEIEGLGQTLDEDTISFLNGRMTLEEYYIGE